MLAVTLIAVMASVFILVVALVMLLHYAGTHNISTGL
jgi:hypothetical protein